MRSHYTGYAAVLAASLAGCTLPSAPDPIGGLARRALAPELGRPARLPEPAPPAGEGPLDLRAIIRIARARNPIRQAADADAEEARARRGIAASALWPQASARYAYAWRNLPPAVKVSFPDPLTGTSVRRKFELGARESGQGAVELTYLLADFGATAGRIHQARWAERLAETEAARTDREIALAATRAYYDLLLGKRLEAIARSTLGTAQLALQDARNLQAAGMALANDVLRAQVRVANAEKSLVEARGGVAVAQAALWNVLGYAEPLDREIAEEVPEIAPLEPLGRYLEWARGRRPEVELVRSQLELEREGLRIAVAGHMPRIVLTGGYHHLDDRTMANPDWLEGGIGLEWELFGGLRRRAERAAARARMDAAGRRAQAVLDRISLEVTRAYEAVRTARQALAHAQRAETQAEENHKVVEARYRQGMATATDLADAETTLEAARQEAAVAAFRLVIEAAGLAIASGSDDPLALSRAEGPSEGEERR